MPRVKPKSWPTNGCLQIGFIDDDELERIRLRLGDLMFRNISGRKYVWDDDLHAWERLSFKGKLTHFCTRKRHTNPKKAYTNPKYGPMFKHLLICHIEGNADQTGLKECIEQYLSWDSMLGTVCYMGEIAQRVYQFYPSSADHSLILKKGLGVNWLGAGTGPVDPCAVHTIYNVSIEHKETQEWKADMGDVEALAWGIGMGDVEGEEEVRKYMAENPWGMRYNLEVQMQPGGWVGGGTGGVPYRNNFESIEEARAYADDKQAGLYTSLVMQERDVFVQDWNDHKAQKHTRCSFPPIRFDDENGFDAAEPREEAYARTKKQKLDELRARHEAKTQNGALG